MCLQFYLSDYHPPLTCSQKFLSLLRNIGSIRAFALLLFSTTDVALKRILKCAVLPRMPLELTFLRRVSLLKRISQCVTWDSACGTIEIFDRKVAKITSTIDSIIDSDFVLSARRLASFTGQTKHCIMSTLSTQH